MLDKFIMYSIYNNFISKFFFIVDLFFSNQFCLDANVKPAKFLQIKKDKQKKEYEISGKMAFGFIKCLVGALCCIIPAPPIQAIGVGLVTAGIVDVIDAAREQGEKNEMDQQSMIPQNRMPADYKRELLDKSQFH